MTIGSAYRRNFTTNSSLSNGAYVTKVEKVRVRSLLIDWIQPSPTGTPEYWDAAVPINSTSRMAQSPLSRSEM